WSLVTSCNGHVTHCEPGSGIPRGKVMELPPPDRAGCGPVGRAVTRAPPAGNRRPQARVPPRATGPSPPPRTPYGPAARPPSTARWGARPPRSWQPVARRRSRRDRERAGRPAPRPARRRAPRPPAPGRPPHRAGPARCRPAPWPGRRTARRRRTRRRSPSSRAAAAAAARAAPRPARGGSGAPPGSPWAARAAGGPRHARCSASRWRPGSGHARLARTAGSMVGPSQTTQSPATAISSRAREGALVTIRIPCAGAIVFDEHRRLLLVRRGREPDRGRWSLPGGRCRPGERAAGAGGGAPAAGAPGRGACGETGGGVVPPRLAGRVDRPAPGAAVYAIEDYACTLVGGRLQPGDDAADARFVPVGELPELPLT